MVRLLRLRVRNFKILRPESEIVFGDGMTVIAGLNESGKSSILDAILYALFGRVIRPVKARNEDLISYGTADATVSLLFEIGNKQLRVTRQLHKSKPTRAILEEVTPQGATLPLATGQEKVNEEIVTLLGGITYQEIVSSTVVAQKELNKLIELNKDDRRRVINAFLNLDSFNAVTTVMSEERRNLEGTGSRVGRVQGENEKLTLLKQELDQFNKNAEEKSILEQQNTAFGGDLTLLQAKYQAQDELCKRLSNYESVARTKENVSLQLTSKKQILEDQQARRERLRKEADSIQKELNELADYDKSEPVLTTLRMKLEKTRDFAIHCSADEQSLQASRKQVSALQTEMAGKGDFDFASARRASQSQRSIIPHVGLAVVLFLGGLVSFFFGALPLAVPLITVGFGLLVYVIIKVNASNAHRQQSVISDLRYLDEKQRDLANEEVRYRQEDHELKNAEQELVDLCSSIGRYVDIFNASRTLGIMKSSQALLDAAEEDRERKSSLQVKLTTISSEMQNLRSDAEMARLKKQISDMELEINQLVFPELPSGIIFSSSVLHEAITERDVIGRALAVTQTKIDQNTKRIGALSKYLDENRDIVSKVTSQVELVRALECQLEVVRRAIDGIQATAESLRTRVRPSVQSHIASILPALTSSRYKAAILDENYGLQVWDPDAGEYKPRDVYSGGTEDQFLLAMRLSFALALLPEVKGHKPEFVFLDEPLSSSDEMRRSAIVEYLASDLSKKFKQIFIISHIGGLEEYAQNTIMLGEGKVL